MLNIQEITAQSKQKHTIRLQDGTSFTMSLEYKPLQIGWFITELSYGTFTRRNLRVVSSPNFLHQFKNLIPFGLACFVADNQEPTTVQDFLSGRAQISVLTPDEVVLYARILSGQATA